MAPSEDPSTLDPEQWDALLHILENPPRVPAWLRRAVLTGRHTPETAPEAIDVVGLRTRAIVIEMDLTLAKAQQDTQKYGAWQRDYESELNELRAKLDAIAPPKLDELHPNGKCTCGGEDRCAWCVRQALAELVDSSIAFSFDETTREESGARFQQAIEHGARVLGPEAETHYTEKSAAEYDARTEKRLRIEAGADTVEDRRSSDLVTQAWMHRALNAEKNTKVISVEDVVRVVATCGGWSERSDDDDRDELRIKLRKVMMHTHERFIGSFERAALRGIINDFINVNTDDDYDAVRSKARATLQTLFHEQDPRRLVRLLCEATRSLIGTSFAKVAPQIGNEAMQTVLDVERELGFKTDEEHA